MTDILEIVSVDDHLHEPPDLFTRRLPAGLRDRAPRVEHTDAGDVWVFEGRPDPVHSLTASAGRPKEEWGRPVRYADMRPGFYDPVARLADMDLDGVVASLCFPSFSGFSGRPFVECADKELAAACVLAYNDFVCEEWAGAAPGRYIPLILLPLWDSRAAAREIERTAALGAKAIAFTENPSHQGLPSIFDADGYWDPVFSAAQDTGMPLCMHIGSSSVIPRTAPDAHRTVHFATTPINAFYALADWLLSGQFVRYPSLVTCFSEGGIGWMPWMVERCDFTWERHGSWTDSPLPEPPSSYVRDHVMGCIIDDPYGAENVRRIGVDNVMLETDYPHPDGSWPNTQAAVRKLFGHLTAGELAKVARANAERVFHFQASGLGQR